MANVRVLRLDRLSATAPGNKLFKLRGYLAAMPVKPTRLLSFGGAWSNHIHALAAYAADEGIPTVGIIRGEQPSRLSATLADAKAWGMQLEFVSRTEYRRKSEPLFLQELKQRFPDATIIPEGGAGPEGVGGCEALGSLVQECGYAAGRVMLACATGTTLAGLVRSLGPAYHVSGICVLKGVTQLSGQIAKWLENANKPLASWSVSNNHHCGGYARVSPALREFMLEFEASQSVPLDPVYTGKLMYAIHNRLRQGLLNSSEPLLAVHTGGLQGRRGFDWLAND